MSKVDDECRALRAAKKERKKIFDCSWLQLYVDDLDVRGKVRKKVIVDHCGSVVLLPIDEEKKILFVKQYRWPIDRILIELPAGRLDMQEEPLMCAQRELQEETGFRAEKLTPIGHLFTTPGYCTEQLYLFLAEKLTPAPLPGDDGEVIELVRFTFDEVKKMIASGEIEDAKTVATMQKYWLDTSASA